MEIVSKSAILLGFLPINIFSFMLYMGGDTHFPSSTHTLARIKYFCNTPYLPVDTHSYIYDHGLIYLREQCVPKSPKGFLM